MVSWENVTNVLNNPSIINENPATIPIDQAQTANSTTASPTNEFIDVN
ncbi:unnamed protein product, partial [Rotaria socialis]